MQSDLGLPERLRNHADAQIDDDLRYIRTADDLMREAAITIELTQLGNVELAESVKALMAERANLIETKRQQLAANDAAIERLVAEKRVLTEALRPFASFALSTTDDDGWSGTRCERERIVDWFGPTDFRRARQAL